MRLYQRWRAKVMDKYSVIVHDAVQAEIEQILFYYFDESKDITLIESISNTIYESIESLSYMPYRFQKSDISENLRRLVIQRYRLVVYYSIEHQTVSVHHIMHGSRNAKKLLKVKP